MDNSLQRVRIDFEYLEKEPDYIKYIAKLIKRKKKEREEKK